MCFNGLMGNKITGNLLELLPAFMFRLFASYKNCNTQIKHLQKKENF